MCVCGFVHLKKERNNGIYLMSSFFGNFANHATSGCDFSISVYTTIFSILNP